MSTLELTRINEEIAFWEQNMFDILICKKIPEHVPDNYSIKKMLEHFIEERDYHSIVTRLAILRKALQVPVH
jgi:hypothetical protein